MSVNENPQWAAPCARFIEYMLQTLSFINMTYRGADVLAKLPDAFGRLMTVADFPQIEEAENQDALNEMKWTAALAKSEIENGFSLLHSHTLLGSWGALEGMVEDLAISRMQHDPSILEDPKLAKVKIPFFEFHNMSDQERLRFLVTEVQRDLGLELKSGATKFEPLLSLVGLSGPIDSRIKDSLFECQNLRNLFAHRGGIVDRKFAANCPNLGYSVGDAIKIRDEDFARSFFGLLAYGATILNRCRAIEGMRLMDSVFLGFEGALTKSG